VGAAYTSERSLQTSLGSSEAGHQCDRRIAYKLAGVPAVNLRDPLRSLLGVGWHAAMADLFRRVDAGSGRYLVEARVTYRGVPGTLDLFDRYTHTVVDWKTSRKSNVMHLRHDGPRKHQTVQVQLYAAGLAQQGEDVRYVALAFVPTDADSLQDLWLWRAPYDQAVADAAIDRVNTLTGVSPGNVQCVPDRLCPWCAHYRPASDDLNVGCPGRA
jgi:hypothetical protein